MTLPTYYQNPKINHINTEPQRAYFIPSDTAELVSDFLYVVR